MSRHTIPTHWKSLAHRPMAEYLADLVARAERERANGRPSTVLDRLGLRDERMGVTGQGAPT
jgi:hypothetical protein